MSLVEAIKLNPVEQLKQLLQLKPEWKDSLARRFAGDVFESTGRSEKELLALMLQFGADPNARSPMSVGMLRRRHLGERTALHHAAGVESFECCELLLEHGANPNLKTALHYAAKMASTNCSNYGSEYAVIDLHNRCMDHHNAQRGADLTIFDLNNRKRRRLPEAVKEGSMTSCEVMLRLGVDPNVMVSSDERVHLQTTKTRTHHFTVLLPKDPLTCVSSYYGTERIQQHWQVVMNGVNADGETGNALKWLCRMVKGKHHCIVLPKHALSSLEACRRPLRHHFMTAVDPDEWWTETRTHHFTMLLFNDPSTRVSSYYGTEQIQKQWQNDVGRTPLSYAVEARSVELCALLIQYGAHPNDEVRKQYRFDISQLRSHTRASQASTSPLFDAVCADLVTCYQLLLKHGADPNVRVVVMGTHHYMKQLRMALVNAANCFFSMELFRHRRMILGASHCIWLRVQAPFHAHGSDPNTQDNSGWTPLHAAVEASFAECCEILVAYDADVVVKDVDGRSPLRLAKPNDDSTQELLIAHYFDWDADIFRQLCEQGKVGALRRYLDNFRIIPHPPRQHARVKVYYHDLYQFCGPPWLPIKDTPLYHVLNGSGDVPSLVDHPVFESVLNTKWGDVGAESSGRVFLELLKFLIGMVQCLWRKPRSTFLSTSHGFGLAMYICESLCFLALLVSTYCSFVLTDTVAGRGISMTTAVLMLTMEALDWNKRRWSYAKDATNWINLVAYVGVLTLGVLSSVESHFPHIDIARAIFIVLLCFCGLEYLRMVPLTSLLIAITFKMVKDVIKFIVLYGVFQIGFSGSFFLLFQHEDSRYNTYSEAFLATFLMLFGDFDADLFLRLDGVKAVVANTLVLLYLVGAMVMLMNLLIAMMSTSYQEVLDVAKVARSIARAEMILRMESVLPQGVRAHMFDVSFFSENQRARAYALHDAEQNSKFDATHEPTNADGSGTEKSLPENQGSSVEAETSSMPLLTSMTKSDGTDALGTQAVLPKEVEQRPVTATSLRDADGVCSPTQKQADVSSDNCGPTATKALRKPNQKKKASRLRTEYVLHLLRPCLSDSVVFEFVDGNENFRNDLQQVQAKLEAKLEKSKTEQLESSSSLYDQLVHQLDLQQQELQKQLKQELQKLEQRQEQQAQHFETKTDTLLTKLDDLQRQLTSDGGSNGVASPSKRFSLKR
ncbi:TPA: hypothetical protein N0F65_010135 [Lagenidium giganteum]|uniref:Ion transport domain-containing protein n=1 Tax=Lagenidium giganteum TaxID=4803 RepID=A0AAV2Z784_9STRA|nr:TPA: hypothetical protein N0F65_010135 [Lagenidium giganteum]